MSLPIRFIPHSVLIDTYGGVSAWIDQIDSTSPDAGVTLFEESTGSQTDREFVAAKEIAPTLPITTSDLSFLATCGMIGVPINSGAAKLGLVAYGREVPLGGLPSPDATAHHLQLSVSDGLIVPVSVRAAHNTVAKLQLMLHGIRGTAYTSGAAPFVYAANRAIVTGASGTSNIYTSGPVKYTITGSSSRLVQGIQDIAVTFGLQVLKESSSGNVFPEHVSIIARMTKIEYTTKDIELIGETGDGISISAFGAYFRAVAANGQRVPEATALHVAILATAGMVTPGSITLQHKQAGTAAFTFTPALNSSLITISTTSAIPTT
jgi:hypothetical protein